MPPLVIHILVPLSTQSLPSRRALVRIPAGLEPEVGSVRPKQPITSPAARRQPAPLLLFEPYRQIGYMASEPWTETKLRAPESPASSSRQARP